MFTHHRQHKTLAILSCVWKSITDILIMFTCFRKLIIKFWLGPTQLGHVGIALRFIFNDVNPVRRGEREKTFRSKYIFRFPIQSHSRYFCSDKYLRCYDEDNAQKQMLIFMYSVHDCSPILISIKRFRQNPQYVTSSNFVQWRQPNGPSGQAHGMVVNSPKK